MTIQMFNTEEVSEINPFVLKLLESCEYSKNIKHSTNNRIVLTIKCKDRDAGKETIEKMLGRLAFTSRIIKSMSSFPVTEFSIDGLNYILVYKPAKGSGGMSETTLNSTITELVPALAFNRGFKTTSIDELIEFISSIRENENRTYINEMDFISGKQFIESFSDSSKLMEKFENALAILDYLYQEDSRNPIDYVQWGYRTKPAGVNPKHKGDIFVKYKTGKMMGISLKAGTVTSKEPLFNSYVRKTLQMLDKDHEIDNLRCELHSNVYHELGCCAQYDSERKFETLVKLEHLETTNVEQYDRLYKKSLSIIKQKMMDVLTSDPYATVQWIKSEILKNDDDVPLVIVKAIGSTFSIIEDTDILEQYINNVTHLTSICKDTNLQDFVIIAHSSIGNIGLKFQLRSNKCGVDHKLGQFYNLSFKFLGIYTL